MTKSQLAIQVKKLTSIFKKTVKVKNIQSRKYTKQTMIKLASYQMKIR